MKLFKEEPNIQFMNKRFYAFAVSLVIIAMGAFLFFSRGFNLGIDFTGGTKLEVSFREATSEDNLRDQLSAVGLEKTMIQRVEGSGNKFFIKTAKTLDTTAKKEGEGSEPSIERDVSKQVEAALMSDAEKTAGANKLDLNSASRQRMIDLLVSKGVPNDAAAEAADKVEDLRTDNPTGLIGDMSEIDNLEMVGQAKRVFKEGGYLGNFTFLSVEMVGPQVGRDLRQKATLATIWAMIGMLIYIGFRFRPIFGIAAVVTLLHDVLVSLTFILLFGVEVSLSVVAGILTIVGYSLNDTIVVFDRVRDNMKLMKRKPASEILDHSINQTLSRTIVTSLTTLGVVMALFFFGGEVIHSFSFTLLVGVIIGTFSSIFQSCAWLKIWEQKFIGAKKK